MRDRGQPASTGIDLPGVYPLHTMEDSFRVRTPVDRGTVEHAVVVRTRYIGLEMADAFTQRGIRVTLVGRSRTIMPTGDASLGEIIRGELDRHGVEVALATEVERIVRVGDALEVRGTGGFFRRTDLVLVASGVEPNASLAVAAGIATMVGGAIRVDRHMRTNVPDVLAGVGSHR